jgi:phospholipid/cholesterol/gamma-HCH transport system substrate-binding protein
MRRAIREHLRDFIAIIALVLIGLLTTLVILSQQRQPYPSWIPFLGDDQFELKVELSTAQAVTPGQGQTVNMAGVQVGDITEVDLENGRAIVTLGIDRPYEELIHEDATVLMRPRTGLQDMTIEVDPGTSGEIVDDGHTIPLSQTEPNVQPDQILASLDGDTRNYLQLLIQGGAKGLGGRGEELSAGLRRFEPLGRDLARINTRLAKRRRNISRAVTNFGDLAEALARSDTRLADFVTSQNDVFGAFARQEANLRETLQELPSALTETRSALESGRTLAEVLGPASEALIPAAQAFEPGQVAAQRLARDTVGPIQNQIRPFTRQTQPVLRHLGQGAGPLGKTVKSTSRTFGDLNRLFNAWAYNPAGAAEEGYLFWTAWLNHNANNTALLEDAHGPLPRGLIMQSCNTAIRAEELALTRPFIWTLQRLTQAPRASVICPLTPPPG